MRSRKAFGVGVLALGLTVTTTMAASSSGEGWRAPKASGGAMGLRDALSLALANSPAVAESRAQKMLASANVRVEQGVFDGVFTFQGSFVRDTMPLTQQAYISQLRPRLLLRALAIAFERMANEIQRQLDSGVFGPVPDCVETVVEVGTTVTEIHCFPESVVINLEALIRGYEDAGLSQAAQAVRDYWRQQLEQLLADSRTVAFYSRQGLRRLGVISTIEDRDTLSLQLALPKTFKNGFQLVPQVQVEAVRNTWRGKPLIGFGGKGVLMSYTSRLGFEFTVPLGRGGGSVAAQGALRAAEAQQEAAAYREASTFQQVALATWVAYYNAAAARARWHLLQASLEREEELAAVARALVEANELAPAELVLFQARLSQTRAQVAQAQEAYQRARVELLKAVGLDAEGVDELPELSDPLPGVPSDEELEALAAKVSDPSAGQRRPEVVAAKLTAKAARYLSEAARADLRREVNLSLTAWYTGLHEEKRGMTATRWWPGVSKAFGGGVGPSAILAIDFSLPFSNSFARGRWASARAMEQQALVRQADLERTIRLRATELLAEVEARRGELLARMAAAEAAARSLDGARELFRTGEMALLDLIVTEETLIAAQVSVVNAQLALAAALARLRYELGELLPVTITGHDVQVGSVLGL